jgi:hypothetical protein
MTNKPKSLQRQMDELRAINIVSSARISELETTLTKVCAKLKMQDLPPIIGTDWMPVKLAAHELDMTIGGVHALVRRKKLRRRPGGLPVLIETKSVQNYKMLISNRRA